jgi:hypothetical protein
MYADGPITLCDRADRIPGRGYDGRLAQLAIYDAALSAPCLTGWSQSVISPPPAGTVHTFAQYWPARQPMSCVAPLRQPCSHALRKVALLQS